MLWLARNKDWKRLGEGSGADLLRELTTSYQRQREEARIENEENYGSTGHNVGSPLKSPLEDKLTVNCVMQLCVPRLAGCQAHNQCLLNAGPVNEGVNGRGLQLRQNDRCTSTEDFLSAYCVLRPALAPAGREQGVKGIKGVLALKGLLARIKSWPPVVPKSPLLWLAMCSLRDLGQVAVPSLELFLHL